MEPATAEVPQETRTDDEEAVETILREYMVVPGVERHGVTALRAVGPQDFELRDAADGDSNHIGILEGHFAVFNRWTEINSLFEGRFMEQIAPGAFKKTFKENLKGMRCLFQHGRDPQVGMKPLGPIDEVGEDQEGARYVVPMDDTSYNRDLLPGLRQGLYGASFRFQVLREEVNTEPKRSKHNPEGIEERTIVECRVREFGPVTFGAYEDATAGLRGITDEYLLEIQRDVHNDLLVVRAIEESRKLHPRASASSAEPPETTEPPAEPEREKEPQAEITGETESRESEGAPPQPAPDGASPPLLPSSGDRLRTTRLPGAAQPLRTNDAELEPVWKL